MTDKKMLTNRYLTVLNDELGWNAVEAGDGDVRFMLESGASAWLSNYAPSDPEFLQMFTGFPLSQFLAQLESPLDIARPEHLLLLLGAASRVTRGKKGTQVCVDIVRDKFEFSVEVVAAGHSRVPSVEHLAAILPRMRSMLITGIRGFHEEVELAGLEVMAAAESTDFTGL